MSDYLTYAAVKTDDIDWLLKSCVKAAHKLGVRFEVPKSPTDEARTWVGLFDNGWAFALADPAVWELLDVFGKVARDRGLACLSGATDGDFTKWSYEFAEAGEIKHTFYVDPSQRFEESEYDSALGDSAALAEVFGVSRIRLQQLLQQFGNVPIQDFHSLLGFELGRAKGLKFVIVAPQTYAAETFSFGPPKAKEGTGPTTMSLGATTKAYNQIEMAKLKGLSHAAQLQASRFGAEGSMGEALDLYMRLRKDGQHKTALSVVDELIRRVESGELRIPELERPLRLASLYGLRGTALYDLTRFDEAIVALRDHALSIN